MLKKLLTLIWLPSVWLVCWATNPSLKHAYATASRSWANYIDPAAPEPEMRVPRGCPMGPTDGSIELAPHKSCVMLNHLTDVTYSNITAEPEVCTTRCKSRKDVSDQSPLAGTPTTGMWGVYDTDIEDDNALRREPLCTTHDAMQFASRRFKDDWMEAKWRPGTVCRFVQNVRIWCCGQVRQ